jgi:hypothetical protein
VKDWLESEASQDWILVLDGADNLTEVFPAAASSPVPITAAVSAGNGSYKGLATFLPLGHKGLILVTTRDKLVAERVCEGQFISKEVMSPEDATTLFGNLHPRGIEEEKDAVNALLKEIAYLPLATFQAASYLRENVLSSVAKHLDGLRSTKTNSLRLFTKSSDLVHSSVESVLQKFAMSFQHIESQCPLASMILKIIACIDRRGIPIRLFERLDANKSAVDEALSRLISLALLTSNNDKSVVDMHPIIHLAVQRFFCASIDIRVAAERAAELMAKDLPHGNIHKYRSVRGHSSLLVKK